MALDFPTAQSSLNLCQPVQTHVNYLAYTQRRSKPSILPGQVRMQVCHQSLGQGSSHSISFLKALLIPAIHITDVVFRTVSRSRQYLSTLLHAYAHVICSLQQQQQQQQQL